MKRIVYGIGAVISAIILILLVIPLFVNVDRYKPILEKEAEQYLGRPLKIEGSIRLSFLPTPSLNMEDVRLANVAGASRPYMATLEKLKVHVALWPLLSKKVKITHVLLSHPEIHLERLKDGRSNWEFSLLDNAKSHSTVEASSPKSTIPVDLSFENIEIIGGEVSYQSPDTTQIIHDLTAVLTISSLKGPLRMEGFLKANHQDVKFTLKVKEFTDDIPLKIKLDAAGADLDVEGIFAQGKQAFKGEFQFKSDTNSMESLIQATVGAVKLPEFISGQINLGGHINASAQGIELRNLTLALEKETIEGYSIIKFSPFSLNAALYGIPGGTTLNLEVFPERNSQRGHVILTIDSPRKLLNWTGYAVKNFPDAFAGLVRLESDFLLKEQHILTLKNMHAQVKETVVNGGMILNLAHKQLDYNLILKGILPLAALADLSLRKDPGPVHLKGVVKLKAENVLSQSTVQLAGLTLSAHGTVSVDQPLNASVKIEANSHDPAQFFKVLMDGPTPVDHFKITTHLTVTPKMLNMSALRAQMGVGRQQITLQGDVHTQLNAKRPFIDANLRLGPLKLEALFPVAFGDDGYFGGYEYPAAPPSVMLVAMKAQKTDQRSHPHRTMEQTRQEGQPEHKWSRTPLDLKFLNDVDGQFKIEVEQLSYNDMIFKNGLLKGTLHKGVLDIPDIHSEFFGGKLNGRFTLNAHVTPDWSCHLTIKNAHLQRLIRQAVGGIKIVSGQLESKAQFRASGNSMFDWVSSLDGEASFQVQDGMVSGFDLKAVSRRLQNLTQPAVLFDLVQSVMTQGKTKFMDCRGKILFNKGIGTVQELHLDAEGGKASGRGQVNLPLYHIDVVGEFQLTELSDLPPFKMRVYGPLDNPAKTLDTSNLQQYMIENVFSTLTGGGSLNSLKDPRRLMKSLLGVENNNGKGKATQPSPTPQASQAPQTPQSGTNTQDPASTIGKITKEPAKVIQNLLKGML